MEAAPFNSQPDHDKQHLRGLVVVFKYGDSTVRHTTCIRELTDTEYANLKMEYGLKLGWFITQPVWEYSCEAYPLTFFNSDVDDIWDTALRNWVEPSRNTYDLFSKWFNDTKLLIATNGAIAPALEL